MAHLLQIPWWLHAPTAWNSITSAHKIHTTSSVSSSSASSPLIPVIPLVVAAVATARFFRVVFLLFLRLPALPLSFGSIAAIETAADGGGDIVSNGGRGVSIVVSMDPRGVGCFGLRGRGRNRRLRGSRTSWTALSVAIESVDGPVTRRRTELGIMGIESGRAESVEGVALLVVVVVILKVCAGGWVLSSVLE